MMAGNDFIRMSYENRIITALSKGPLIMADIRRVCNGLPGSNFDTSVYKCVELGKVDKKVNGHTLYFLTSLGEQHFKRLKKEARNLFFR